MRGFCVGRRTRGGAGPGRRRAGQGPGVSGTVRVCDVLLAPTLSGTSCYERRTRGDLGAASALCTIRTLQRVTGLVLTGGGFSKEFSSVPSDLSGDVSEESHQSHQDPPRQVRGF